MKKLAYVSPATDIFYLATGHLLNTISNPTETNVDDLGVSEDEYEGEGLARRRRNQWDDDQEEQEEKW